MMDEYNDMEKRQFLRFAYNKPVRFRKVTSLNKKRISSEFLNATARNLSASGIYFITRPPEAPNIASLLMLDLDYNALEICKEIEDHVLFMDNRLIGRVVRLEDNTDGTCGVGVAFLKKGDSK